jgi:hypothetical protein
MTEPFDTINKGTEDRHPAWNGFYPPVTRQTLRDDTAAFQLNDTVPPEVRERFNRCLSTYRAGYEDFGQIAAATEQAIFVIEQAVRLRLQENPTRAAEIDAADNGLPPFKKRQPLGLFKLLTMAMEDGLLSRHWHVPFICERRNFIAHGRETGTFPPPWALQTFRDVADLVNELWGQSPP